MKIIQQLSILIALLFAWIGSTQAQTTDGTVLLISNLKGKVILDGTVVGENKPLVPFRFNASPGDHYIQIQGNHQGKLLDKGDVVNVEAEKQKILKFTFDEITEIESAMEAVTIADLNVPMPGTLTQMAWTSKNTGAYPYPTYYYAFEKGDKVIVDLTMSNLKGTNSLTILTHPTNVSVYSNNNLTELNQLELTISERTILKFILYSNHAIDRNGFLKIKRIPANAQTARFNTSVSKKPIYSVSKIVEKQQFYINSGSNATFKGGKSRINIPVTLPDETVEWYYRVSAFRDSAALKGQQGSKNLFSELTSMVVGVSSSGLGAVGNMLLQPPGANFCDVYLLTPNNAQPFLAKTSFTPIPDGTRENIKSGNVRVTCCNRGNYFLGLKNPDSSTGIHVNIEAVAITMYEDYTMDHKD
jgi:hypothetical protein